MPLNTTILHVDGDLVFESLPFPTGVVDPHGRIVAVNEAGSEFAGLARDALVGTPVAALIHEDDRAAFLAQFTDHERGRIDLRLRMQFGNAEPLWSRMTGRLTSLRHDSASIFWVLAATPVQAEVEQLALVDTIMGAAPVGIEFLDTDLRVRRVNDHLAAINGAPGEAHIGRLLAEIVPEVYDQIEPFLLRALDGEATIGVPVSGEIAAEPGRQRHWSASYYPVRDSHGSVMGVGAIVEDVTRQREREARLRWMASVIETSRAVISIAEPDGRLQYLNPFGRELLRVESEETTALHTRDFAPASMELDPECAQALGHGGRWHGLSWVQPRDGDGPIPMDTTTWVIRDPEKVGPHSVATVMTDARERLATEHRLAAAAEQRAQLLREVVMATEEERNRIAADIHDDSIQALAVADLRLQLLTAEMAEATDGQRAAIAGVRSAINEASTRLRHLLFRLDGGAEGGLAEAIRKQSAAQVEGTKLVVMVRGDERQGVSTLQRTVVLRIVREAMNNVIKHAAASRAEITITDDDALVVSVEDDGVGIDAVQPLPGHLGLTAMTERAAQVAGMLTVSPRAAGGTRVELVVPRRGD